MKKHNIAQKGKRALSMLLAAMMVLSCWVWVEPNQLIAEAAGEVLKDHYLFAYFTGTSKEGQTIHLAVSKDGYNYTALRNNEPVIIPSKGVGNVRDPYIWYNEQDNYYYILATDLDFTDGGGDYSNNSQSFIIWRSKDLVNWYDETFIDVSKMAHLIGDTRNMTSVWAPQVLWDGSAYVVYFTLACNATSWFDIVYLKTTDLLDPNAYYEFDYILGNGTGNGVDNGYGVIDADIIHNPGDGKYYLFYKVENHDKSLGTDSNNSNEALRKIFYYVGDTPTGPFTNPGDTKWTNAGYCLWPDAGYSLEGCNAVWDNYGNLLVYADEFAHKNASGEPEAYFRIAKSDGTNFKSWTYPDVNQHNINALSPRHGSVVKITEAEYNRLLNNSYNISSSSYPDTEVLKDHLVAQYFTTNDVKWNNVIGQPNLASSTGITMKNDLGRGWYASFDSTNGGWAEVDFDSLFRKTNGLNYEDGFTITFSARLQTNETVNNENNDRIYEIANIFGDQSSENAYYTHFSPGGGGNGSYLGNYNGPVDKGVKDWLNDKDGANRDDGCFHEYIISYATGNVMVYVDGQLVISKNRFGASTRTDDSNDTQLNNEWFEALGSNATMLIGKSGWDADPLFKGNIQNLCIYDCSMSYYDAQSMNDDYKENLGWVGENTYNGITSKVPTFQNTNADRMNSLPNKEQHFSNILYTSETVKNYDGNHMSTDSAAWHSNGNDFYFALYYPETTVLLYDGVKDAIMPVSFGAYCENSRASKGFLQIYPTTGPGSTADLGELEISQNWAGWYNNGDYYNCIVEHADGYIGRNSTTSSWSHITDKKNYDCHWGAPLKVNGDKINFNGMYYKKYNLTWQVNGGTDGNYAADHSANMTSDNDIYVINFKPILDLRNTITEAMYNEVMNNSALCSELREKYAAAVYAIRTMDPTNYGFDAAPLTATKACAKAISEAIGTYEGVMAEIARENTAGTHGHQCTELPAREATCSVNGLTAGSYCFLCGEIVKKQQVLAPLPHTFGNTFTENGKQYKQCSVCGVKIEYQASGVRYANLFSLNRWINSASSQVFSGTISTNSANGTITIVNQNNSEIYTRGTYDGQNLVATRDFGNDCIPVTGGKTYVVEATSLASSTSGGEVFVFQYNKDGLAYKAIPTVLGLAPGQTAHNEFTVDKNAAYIELRFDANDAGKTITYSQIGVYEKEEFDKFGATTADARLGFYPGESKDLCYPNPAPGYTFNGWYTVDGRLIDDVNQLNNPTTIVYGNWIEAGFDITYDSIFSFSEWAKSSCNKLWYGDEFTDSTKKTLKQRLYSDKGIVADAEKGTISITYDESYVNTETINYGARTSYWNNTGNLYYMPVEANTNYIIEFTAISDDGAKPNICAYFHNSNKSLKTYPEIGNQIRWSTGTHRAMVNSGEEGAYLVLRFDNAQRGSTVTFSNIAVYKADTFLDHSNNITNREYRRYYPTKMGIGNVFEYIPTRPGYTFDTWMADTNNDGLGDENWSGKDDTFLVEQNWHLYSTWKENSYTIKYDANGGSGSIANQTVKYTADVALASSGFTKSGYTLVGWSTKADATTATYQKGQTVSRLNGDANGTTTLYAIWQQNTPVNVTFDNMFDYSQFNIGTSSLTVDARTDIGFTVTAKAGNDDANTGFSYAIDVEPGKTYILSADTNFVPADGDAKGFDIYINTLNSSMSGEKSFTVDTSNGAHNEGDQYMSLTGQKQSVTKPYIKFTAGPTTEYIKIRFDANNANSKLTVNNIRITEDNGVTVSPVNKKVTSYTEYGTLPTPTKVGYTFNGWKHNGTPVNASSIVNSTSTVYLKSDWSANNYTVKFDANGGSGTMSNQSMTYNTAANLTANVFARTGYTFNGWNTKADGSGTPYADKASVKNLTATANGTITLYAQWKANSYTVKFDANGGSGSMSDQTMTYGTAKSLTANTFTKKGYTFAGWNTAANGSGTGYTDKQSVSTLAPSGTVTLYAQWTANSYKVAFDGNGATSGSMSEQSITYDKATALATNGFSKTGYTFKGWSETKGGTVKYNNGASVTNLAESGSVTLYAVWEANSYTIRFNSNGGTGTMNDLAMTYDVGKALTANKFTRTGYTFAGWSTTEGGAVVHTDGKTVKNLATSGVVTLYAVWNEHTYNVGYDANGPVVDIDTTKNVNYTSNVTLPAADALEWTDGTFRGWSLTQFATTAEFAPGATVPVATLIEKANIANGGSWTLYAVWEITGNCFKADKDYVDFGLPVTFNTAENDSEILGYHISTTGFKTSFEYGFDSTNYAKTLTVEGKGIFRVETDAQNSSEYYITFTPTGIINEAIEVTYYGKLTYSDGTVKEFDNTVTVIPASNMLYEEKLITLVSGDSVAWSQMGTSSSKQQEASTANDIYGYDSAYASSTGFSDGTYYKAIVTDGTVKQKMTNVSTFTFAGTGFDLISACGTNTGIQLIKVKNSEGKLINSYIIDTYFSTTDLMTDGGAEGSLLHQVPILSFRTKNHDTYTVEITAAYLSMAQALKHTGTAAVSYASAPVVAGNGVEIVTTTSTASSELINEFEKMGVDMGDNVELRWMDDNSVLNGGTGATEIATTVPKNGLLSGYAQQYLSSSVTSLANYIDGFRVYNPLNGGDPIYDIEKEQNPTYYNIVEDIGNASSGNFTYVQSGDPDFNFDENIFDYGAYLTQGGPKGEIYLEPGDAIAFRFNAETNGDDSVSVMLGMRAAKGSAIANVTTNDKGVVPVNKTVSSATEMYYDVSDAVTVVDGVVVIAVANTGTGTLAVNNLKLVNGTLKSAGTGETPSGSNDVIGGNSIVPEAVVPVVPVAPDANGNDAVQGDTPDTNLPENGEVDNTNPETDTKDNIEDNTEKDADNSVTTMFPGMPASIASFLELLFEFLGQLVSSLGF